MCTKCKLKLVFKEDKFLCLKCKMHVMICLKCSLLTVYGDKKDDVITFCKCICIKKFSGEYDDINSNIAIYNENVELYIWKCKKCNEEYIVDILDI